MCYVRLGVFALWIALVKGGSAKEFFKGELINELLEPLGWLVIQHFRLISTQPFAGT